MLEAIKEAKKGISQGHGGPFGAVIVCKGKIVAKAHNTVLHDKDATCHAEMQAIRKASKALKKFDLSGCELYTTGKPCPMCKSALKWAKIKSVYFGCDYSDAKRVGFSEKDGNSNGYVEKRLLSKECKELYSEYKKLKMPRY